MNKLYLSFASLLALGLVSEVRAETKENVTIEETEVQVAPSTFTDAQRAEINKMVGEYITKNPSVVVAAFKAQMAEEEKEAVRKMEKAVADHKHKIFKNAKHPVLGNPKGDHSVVVFLDPYCGYCKKLQSEVPHFIEKNKDVKVVFVDLPIMGERSVMAVKAMLAANEQGKYSQMQKLVFSSPEKLTHKKVLKKAKSLGLDTERFEADMKSKEMQSRIDENLALAETIGITATPTLIINEKKVNSGYLPPEELQVMVRETAPSVEEAK